MAKYKRSDFISADDVFNSYPPEKQAEIRAEADRMMAEIHLANVRKALTVTQADLAEKTGLKQGEISRIENSVASVQIKTLQRYMSGLGGKLRIVADFPDGTRAEIPLRNGKPVKSQATAVARNTAHKKLA